MALKNKTNNKETLLFIVGSFLLIISLILYNYEKILEISNELKSNIETEKFKENTKVNNYVTVDVNVNYQENDLNAESNSNYHQNTENSINYIGFLEIDKIYLKQGLLPINNPYNNINYHVQILPVSNFPDVLNGNFVLAAHSGTSGISYFKNLYKLTNGDIAKVYYNGKIYKYSIVNIYNEEKDGSVNIYRDTSKTTLTLITCTKNDKLHQTIYIAELMGVETY